MTSRNRYKREYASITARADLVDRSVQSQRWPRPTAARWPFARKR